MRVMLELPGNVLKENLDGIKQVVEFYLNNNSNELNSIPVTKNYAGAVVSYFGDEEWDLSAYIDGKITNKYKIVFSEISSLELANELKIICFTWIYTIAGRSYTSPLKPTTIITLHSKLMQIYKYLDTMRCDSVARLSHPVLFFEFCNYISKREYSHGHTMQIFGALYKIQDAHKYVPIDLELPTEQSSHSLALEYCCNSKVKSDQFYAIPTSIMEKVYSKCIEYLEELHPHRELLCDVATEMRINYEMGRHSVDQKIESGLWQWLCKDSPSYRVEVNKSKPQTYKRIIESYLLNTPLEKYITHSSAKFQAWLVKIQTVCYIICAAFTGMRKSELYGLHSDSFKARTYNGKDIYTLQSYQYKMSQGRGKLAEWVTSPLTKMAIELAEALSRNMRQQLLKSEDPMKNQEASCLWLTQSRKNELPKLRFEGHLRSHFIGLTKEAGAYIDEKILEEFKLINPNRNPLHADKKIQVGKIWPLTTHQFRRTFAVFVRRHNLCSTIAVKDQFKHLDVHTSDWYGEGSNNAFVKGIETDSELKEFIQTVRNEIVTDTVFRWYNKSDKLYGKRGLEIMKERVRIPESHKSWDEINKHVKAGRINFVGTLHSYCLAGYECRMDKVASSANCVKCENQLIDEEKALTWTQRHKWTTEQLIYLDSVGQLTPSIESHYITQIRAAEKVMHYFRVPFRKYEKLEDDNE